MLMTMGTPRKIPAGKFKAECLALLDKVERTGECMVITKRGRPVAQIGPLKGSRRPSLQRSVHYHGDIVAPLGERWDADQ